MLLPWYPPTFMMNTILASGADTRLCPGQGTGTVHPSGDLLVYTLLNLTYLRSGVGVP